MWRAVTDAVGVAARDALWDYPDLMPTADDIDDPAALIARLEARARGEEPAPDEMDDALAQLLAGEERGRSAASGGDEPATTRATTDDDGAPRRPPPGVALAPSAPPQACRGVPRGDAVGCGKPVEGAVPVGTIGECSDWIPPIRRCGAATTSCSSAPTPSPSCTIPSPGSSGSCTSSRAASPTTRSSRSPRRSARRDHEAAARSCAASAGRSLPSGGAPTSRADGAGARRLPVAQRRSGDGCPRRVGLRGHRDHLARRPRRGGRGCLARRRCSPSTSSIPAASAALMAQRHPAPPDRVQRHRRRGRPLRRPGRTACLACVAAHRRDADPAWPLVAAQLIGRPLADIDAAIACEAGIVAARLISEGERRAARQTTHSLTLRAGSLHRTSRAHRPHAECRCRSLAGTGRAADLVDLAPTTATAFARPA